MGLAPFGPTGNPVAVLIDERGVRFQSPVDGRTRLLTPEGVIGKGDWYVSPGRPAMFKHKSRDWLARLREKCSSEEEFQLLR